MLEKIQPETLAANVFDLIGNRWLLLTAGDETGGFNTMTVSWGGLGVLWGKYVATCYVRPQRYTRKFMEKSGLFTLSAYPETMHSIHTVCGGMSGRDVNKAKECGLTPVFTPEGATYFAEAELAFVCKKLYFEDFDPSKFLDKSILNNYPNQDFHRMYVGEILEVLQKQA